MSRYPNRGLAGMLTFALAFAVALGIACTGDSEPEATPTATQAPASTPTPTPTPEPTPTPTPDPTATGTLAPPTAAPTAEAAEPAGSMADLVIGTSTRGQDLIDRLSEGEAACIKSAAGDSLYQVLLGAPLVAAAGDPALAAPLLACLTVENVVLIGAAIIDLQVGGRTATTRQCIVELGLEHPELIFVRLGLEWPGGTAGHGAEIHSYLREYYGCLTESEKGDYAIRLWAGLAVANPVTGRDLVESLTQGESMCLEDVIGNDRWELFLGAQIAGASRSNRTALLEQCFPGEGTSRLFAHLTGARLGGLSESSHECVESFAVEHTHFVGLVSGGAAAAQALGEDEFVEIARDAAQLFDCLNDEELIRLQSVLPVALSGQ
ncbi:MAG: hypothetical protein OXC71_03480 [Chloroflexi bacterium]|nr:hypothetical protein [Chloroflexota bacterium]